MSRTTHSEQTTTYRASSLEELGRQVDDAVANVPEGWTLSRVDVDPQLAQHRSMDRVVRTTTSYVGQVQYQRTVRE